MAASSVIGSARHDDFLENRSHPEALYQQLDSLGVNYFLANQTEGFADFTDSFLEPEFLASHLKLIWAHSALLFELEDRPVQLEIGPELLTNRGFEELSGGAPVGWFAVGNPRMDASGASSHAGKTAVLIDAKNWLEQKVAVRPGSLYVLRHYTRAAKPGQVARVQINWVDRNDNGTGYAIRDVSAETDWQSRAMALTAPPKTAMAIVFASTQDNSEVWFDDFSFTEIRYH